MVFKTCLHIFENAAKRFHMLQSHAWACSCRNMCSLLLLKRANTISLNSVRCGRAVFAAALESARDYDKCRLPLSPNIQRIKSIYIVITLTSWNRNLTTIHCHRCAMMRYRLCEQRQTIQRAVPVGIDCKCACGYTSPVLF
jgi:hypothetical protein